VHVHRWVLAMALAASLAASAQTITSTFQTTTANGSRGPVTIGQARCTGNSSIVFTIDWTLTGPPASANGETVEYWVTKDSATCSTSTAPAAGTGTDLGPGRLDVNIDSATVSMSTLLQGLDSGCGNTTASAASPFTTYFCVRRTTPGTILNSNGGFTGTSLAVQFALVPPAAPDAPSITPGDQHLQISWASVSGASTYDVYAVPHGQAPDPNNPVKSNVTGTSFDVTATSAGPLEDGTQYDVYLRTEDAYANVSGLSPPATDKPIQIDDFYARYRGAGGSAEGGGGCASGGADLLAAIAAALTLCFCRRRRAALLGAVLLLPAAARAQDWTDSSRSPRRVLVALKIDRYDPQIDSEGGLAGTPYHDIFHGRAPLRWQLEADWEIAHPFGSFLLGGTVGFWQNYGHGIVTNPDKAVPPVPSSDTASLDIIPIGIVATYRFDVLADRYRWLPFIPYAQAGLMTALWASFNGTGHVRSEGGGRGSGWTRGYTTALGIAVNLDGIDPDLAREAYNDIGIQRTSLFAEYAWTRLDDFGKSGALILSDRAWRFGFAVEF
jgi:hypothetical protein